MIYFTGDTHGQTEKMLNFINRFELSFGDTAVRRDGGLQRHAAVDR